MRYLKKNFYEELTSQEEDLENNEKLKNFSSEEELEEKKEDSIWIRITRILIIYLIVGFLGWNFFYFVFNSKYCNIKEVIIKGNNYLSKDEVLSQSHINLGENIFRLDINQSIDFLKQEPWIKEAEIKRIIPNRIIISIEERRPSVIIGIEEGFFLADKKGRILSTVNMEEDFKLPLITGLKDKQVMVGGFILDPEFNDALEVINSANIVIPDNFFEIKVLGVNDFFIYGKINNIILRTQQTEEVIDKANLIREAYEKVINENLSVDYLDLRFQNRVVIKLKE